MHEFSLMESVLASAGQVARQAGASKVTAVNLRIGRLSAVLPEAMQFAHQALTPNTIFEASELRIDFVEARSRCLSCGVEFAHDRFHRACPECDSLATELLAGRELEIESIEVEDDN
ncbi:MAG: hydrogenase maturation nickel metallochaperone HypA [Coriobacteriia bacterium]|nr:hydrogenase maturation nickel metallochaperone HypA [Coriobacteriia bacterium]